MSKRLALCIILFISMALICSNANATRREYTDPIDISGKILDQYGKPFTEQVELEIFVDIFSYDPTVDPGHQESHENKIYRIPARGGIFSWKGEGSDVAVEAIKEGYHSTIVDTIEEGTDQTIKSSDIIIYLVPKGVPSKLEYTGSTRIPRKEQKESGGKDCGWSFLKRWYFPVDEEETVWLTQSFDERRRRTYTMKEPGGFVLFPGFPQFESKSDEHRATFELMTEAPEEGYAQKIQPWVDNENKVRTDREIYYYFRTPDGKYGKIAFHGGWFDYYLQPDGSRNLELEKRWFRPPRNPKAVPRTDDPEAYPVDE